jgi:hypothetical protein
LFSKNAAQVDYICAAVLSFTMALNCRCKNEDRIELMSNVFIPEQRVFGDERSHHLRSAISPPCQHMKSAAVGKMRLRPRLRLLIPK